MLVHQTKETAMTKQPGLDNRHRDKDGEIAKRHGNTLVSHCASPMGPNSRRGVPATKN